MNFHYLVPFLDPRQIEDIQIYEAKLASSLIVLATLLKAKVQNLRIPIYEVFHESRIA